jgi:2,4-dienoyl-CoA reductase-like NADH-dependent reductase (Old Yellow Enzyme family)
MMSPHARLLSPLDLGFIILRNRVVMGAMHTAIETLDRPMERLEAYFAARARGEAGLILTGGVVRNYRTRRRFRCIARSVMPCIGKADASRCRFCTRDATGRIPPA